MSKKNRQAGRPIHSKASPHSQTGHNKPHHFYRNKSNHPNKSDPIQPDTSSSYLHLFMYRYSWKLVLLLVLSIILLKLSSTSSFLNETQPKQSDHVPESSAHREPLELGHNIAESAAESSSEQTESQTDLEQEISDIVPTLFIGILVRNKAHSIPYLLRGLEIQNYPKQKIQIQFVVDNCMDESLTILKIWADQMSHLYHTISIDTNQTELENNWAGMWTDQHYEHVIQLRQKLLTEARKSWADFYLSLDADVILMNTNSLSHLIKSSLGSKTELEKPNPLPIVLSPLMNCSNSEFYANFWGGMSEAGYYLRSEHYFDWLHRHRQGLFPVAMVHTIFLINLKHPLADSLNYDPPPPGYDGPRDDLILFARSAQAAGIQFYLDNTQFFGYIPAPVEEQDLFGEGTRTGQWLAREIEIFTHLRLQAMIDLEDRARVLPSPVLLPLVANQLPKPSKLGFDEVYFINLVRRPDRRRKMEYIFEQLGIDAKHFEAVDGKLLTPEQLDQMGIKQMPGYFDPYHKRSLKLGEIGCFLSHYNLWKEMVQNGYERILILEDDLRFESDFIRNLNETMYEADTFKPDWDLLYIGRKRMSKNEKKVAQTRLLAHPDYTYWTLGYALRLKGAHKLLDQKPLGKMVAVDEYLPIMFDRHPRKEWLENFHPRNLVALSAEPLLLEPQRYTGEKFYVSDTEDSEVITF